MISPKIFEFFAAEAKVEKVREKFKKMHMYVIISFLFPVSQDQLLVNFYNLEATHIGSMGTTVAELRK